jgi:hypothetical protein
VSAESPGPAAERSSPRERSSPNDRDFDVFRLRLGDAIALLAAFALLFIMAGDWYTTSLGQEARDIVERQGTTQPGEGLFDEGAVEDARIEAEQAERNAWQISSVADLVVLLALLATIGLTLAAAALQAAGRQFPDIARSPRALAASAVLLTLVLLVLQAALRLDPDTDVVVAVGLPLAVGALGMIACGVGLALRDEREPATPDSSPAPATGQGDDATSSGPEGAPGGAYTQRP